MTLPLQIPGGVLDVLQFGAAPIAMNELLVGLAVAARAADVGGQHGNVQLGREVLHEEFRVMRIG